MGPSGLPSHDSPEQAIDVLLASGYDACEIEFGRGFWMGWDYARQLGKLARHGDVALSIHAPMAAFLGHAEYGGRKHHMAIGMLDHSAGIAVACGAAPVVIHPGFLLGRERAEAIDAVVLQLGELRERLAAKGRAVPFGVEVMGRVRELGSLDDVVEICSRLKPSGTDAATLSPDDWVRPVLDFAHLHATSDGGFTSPDIFAAALARADAVLAPGVPFHIHFSDISFANRNEKAHLPYGEGTLRAEPLDQALARFNRPATVIAESPDESSNQAIRAILQRVPTKPGQAPAAAGRRAHRMPGATIAARAQYWSAIAIPGGNPRLAPRCAHCGCTIVGHGVESNSAFYCCAHCAHAAGVQEAVDV